MTTVTPHPPPSILANLLLFLAAGLFVFIFAGGGWVAFGLSLTALGASAIVETIHRHKYNRPKESNRG